MMADESERITVEGGKYTLVMDPTGLRALRYGEDWRDLAGDGFVMALGHEILALRETKRVLLERLGNVTAYVWPGPVTLPDGKVVDGTDEVKIKAHDAMRREIYR